MLSRLAHVSRYQSKAYRPLCPGLKRVSSVLHSHTTETVRPASWTAENTALDWSHDRQSTETAQADLYTFRPGNSRGRAARDTQASISAVCAPSRPRPRQLYTQRAQEHRSKTARLAKSRGLEPSAARPRQTQKCWVRNIRNNAGAVVKLRFLQEKGQVRTRPRPRPRVSYVLAPTDSGGSLPLDVRPPQLRSPISPSQQRYLQSPQLVSLGSWASGSSTRDNDSSLQRAEVKIDEVDTSWSTRFMRLEEGHRLTVWRTIDIENFIQKFAGLHESRKYLHQLWLHLPGEHQLDRWQDAMLWCMQNSPQRALVLLLAIFKSRAFRPPRFMIEDCLHFLARHHLLDVSKADPMALDALLRLTFKFVDGASPEELRSYSISQDVIQLLLKHCDGAQALLVYEFLNANRAELHPNTMLHFLERFVDMGKLELSMKLLEIIASSSFGDHYDTQSERSSKDQIQSACVKLLRTRWGLGEPYRIQSNILTQMLEMGIRPNTQMYNTILLNMIEGRDFGTAWKTYDIAKQSDYFKTDSATYGILAKGAKLSGDSNILDKVLRETHEDPHMLQDLRLASGILNAIGELGPYTNFSAMLDFYKLHFDLRPLQDLTICEPGSEAVQGGKCDGKWPTKYILGQMILAYNKAHVSSDNLLQKYSLYYDFVQQEHPLIAPLARDDYVANSFIMAFGQRNETLQYCTTVVKHMLSTPPIPGAAPYAGPSVQTWSILVGAYMRHKQKHAAEKVLTMMRARGLQPDLVTWNTLIGGYSAMQDAEGAADALNRMEAEGFECNPRTLKGLGRLWDRGKLLNLLKTSLQETPEKHTSPYLELQELLGPKEVEGMAEGWESEVGEDRANEIKSYLRSYRQKHL